MGRVERVFLDYAYVCICIVHAILSFVKQKNPARSVSDDLLQQLTALWPAIKGSLALVYKPCIRPNCAACASGQKHPNYLLAFTSKGKRRCLYVPMAMVPTLERALENGRKIEQLLYDLGPALLREFRTQNPAKTGPRKNLTPSATSKRPRKS